MKVNRIDMALFWGTGVFAGFGLIKLSWVWAACALVLLAAEAVIQVPRVRKRLFGPRPRHRAR
jgi:hypothetical protein